MTEAATATSPPDAARRTLAEQRSRELLDAAARLMERKGSEAVSMQALANEAGVSVGLIYRYFGSKDDVLLAVITDVLDAFATAVPAAVESPFPRRRGPRPRGHRRGLRESSSGAGTEPAGRLTGNAQRDP